MSADPLDDILDDFLLGNMSDEQSAQLQQALQSDPAARSQFVRSVLTDVRLHSLARSGAVLPTPESLPLRKAAQFMPFGAGGLWRVAFAAAGLLAAGTAAVLYVTHRDTPTIAPIKAPASETVTIDGWIRSADAQAGTFILVGHEDDAPQIRFRVGRTTGARETAIFLEGVPANFQTAIQPNRLATVTYLKVGDDLLAQEVDVTLPPDHQ